MISDIIICHPVDEPPQALAKAGHIGGLVNRAQFFGIHRVGRKYIIIPYHANHLARPQGNDNDAARPYVHAGRHFIIKRAYSLCKQDNANAIHTDAIGREAPHVINSYRFAI